MERKTRKRGMIVLKSRVVPTKKWMVPKQDGFKELFILKQESGIVSKEEYGSKNGSKTINTL